MADLLRRAAADAPDDIAVRVDEGASLTWGAWQQRSGTLAGGLTARGVAPGDRVVLSFDAARWADYAVAYLAVRRAAAVAVPAHADLTDRELVRIVDHCRASLVLAAPDLAGPDVPVPVATPAELEDEGRDPPGEATAGTDGPAEILYHSRPLTVPMALPRSPRDVTAGPVAALTTLSGISALVHTFPVGTPAAQDALHACLTLRLPTVVAPLPVPPEHVCALLTSVAAPVLGTHPAVARALLDANPAGCDPPVPAGVMLAGGRPAQGLLVRLATTFPGADLLVVDPLAPAPQAGDPNGHHPVVRACFAHHHSRPGAVGRPVHGTAVRITDRTDRPVDPGEVGRVWLGSADPAGEANTPGDAPTGGSTDQRGYLDHSGFLYLTGEHGVVRRDGTPVSRAEVEEVLTTHPSVGDAAVVGVPDDRAAEELIAAVVCDPPVREDELTGWARDRLRQDEIPDRVVVVAELPRNTAGILLRRELRRRLGFPPRAAVGTSGAPGAAEETVAAVWRRVLDRDDFGPTEDFFELDGDWRAAAAVLSLLEDAFGVPVSVEDFLAAPTVAGLAATVDALGPPDGEGRFPVALSQEGMVWHERFAPGCQNLPGLARRLRGPLDVEALRGALDEIVRRQAALRTTVEVCDGRPVQVVHPHRSLDLPVHDMGDLPPDEREAEVERLVVEAGRRPFDLVTGPLFAPRLVRLAADDHVLVIRTHHLVFDDWSVGVFRRELRALYTAFARGDASPLPEPSVGFAPAVQRQRRRLAGPAGGRELAFWRGELDGAPLTTQLPVDDPHRSRGSPQAAGQPVTTTVPPDVHAGLREVARHHRATVFMAALTAFGVLVQRYTGQDDLLLTTVVANRNRAELEGLVGCFTKKVPLRLRLDGDPTFTEALTRTRTALLGALTHQDVAFPTVIQDVLGGPAAAHGLVSHPAVMFQGVTPEQELDLPGLDTRGFQTSTRVGRAHFMADDDTAAAAPPAAPWGGGLYHGSFVILSVRESDEGLSVIARGAFHGPAVRDLLASYRTLLADIVAAPARPLSQLELVDRQAALRVLNRARGPAEPLTPGLVAADRPAGPDVPDAVAVRSADGALTHAELDRRIEGLAARLHAHGVTAGTRVGITLGASVDAVAVALATWRLGAAWVGLDPQDTAERLRRITAEAGLTAVVGEDPRGLSNQVPVLPVESGGADEPVAAPRADPDPAADAVVFYGSAAAAVPRGVVLDRRATTNLRVGLRRDVHPSPGGKQPGRRVCLSAPPTRGGFVRQLVALLDGHTLYVPETSLADDPQGIVSLLHGGHVDLIDATPSELDRLLAAGLEEALTGRGGRAGEVVIVVGTRGPVTPELWRRLCSLPGARGHLLYDPPACAFAATGRTAVDASVRAHVGRPLANVIGCVLDVHGRPAPPRAVGELHLGGPSLAWAVGEADDRGPPASVEVPGEAGAGRLCPTGQLARALPDGAIELLGPVDADVDLRGFRIDPARVRSALRSCPGVRDAAVSLRRDEDGDPRLVARIAPDGQMPTRDELRALLWTRLPGYAWPSEIRQDPDLSADPDPTRAAAARRPRSTPQPPTAPSPGVNILAALWAEILDVEHIPADADYWQAFSFLEALGRARDAGLPVAGHQVTRNRTVAGLAADLAAHRRAT